MRYTYSFLGILITLLFACKADNANNARVSPDIISTDAPLDLSKTPMKDFLFLTGSWEGEFDYLLNPATAETEIMPMTCKIKQDKHRITLNYIYAAKDGREIADNQEIFHDKSRGIYFGGNYNAIESIENTSENTTIVLSRIGSENKKPADVKTTITSNGNQVKIIKEVKPEGKDEFSYRNTYTLNKSN